MGGCFFIMEKINLERIFWEECNKFDYDTVAVKHNYSLIVSAFFQDRIYFTHYDIGVFC
jgi:hypothetical protein